MRQKKKRYRCLLGGKIHCLYLQIKLYFVLKRISTLSESLPRNFLNISVICQRILPIIYLFLSPHQNSLVSLQFHSCCRFLGIRTGKYSIFHLFSFYGFAFSDISRKRFIWGSTHAFSAILPLTWEISPLFFISLISSFPLVFNTAVLQLFILISLHFTDHPWQICYEQ